MAHKKKPKSQIVFEMTNIIVSHLETIPPDERKQRVAAFKKSVSRSAKSESARSKVPSTSRTRGYSRRIPA